MNFILFIILFPLASWAHQTSVTGSGKPFFWPSLNVPVQIKNNTSDLPASTTQNIILNSINEWNTASSAKLIPTSSSSNQIRFSSDFSIYGSAVIGLTEVSYNSSGAIQKAVILLNDNYHFTQNQNSYTGGFVFLGDVVTHEIGHFLGLSHSEVLKSSMFYTSFPGQSSLADDDIAGVRKKYGPVMGKIVGKVQGGKKIGVLGVHVQAISRTTGEVIGVISDEAGNFNISGLNINDSYYLYTSPTKKIESLPGYYANVQTSFCPGPYVGSFFTACGRENDGFPQPITLTNSNSVVNVGSVTINCSLRSNDDYAYQKLESVFAPVSIWDSGDIYLREKAFAGYFSIRDIGKPETLKIDLSSIPISVFTPRYLKLNFIVHPFGNLLKYTMKVSQNSVNISTSVMTQSLLLGTYDTNLSVNVPLSNLASDNVFEVELSAQDLGATSGLTFPSVSEFGSSNHMPYLLVMGINEGLSAITAGPLFNTQQVLSENSSCLDAPFTYSVSRTLASSENGLSTDASEAGVAGAACGTIEPPSSGPGSSLPLLMFGFLLTMFVSLFVKKTKNILS